MKKVLLLHPEEQSWKGFEERLVVCGYHVDHGYDAQEGYDLCLERKPDAVVASLRLPRRDGIELCWKLRNEAKLHHLAFLLIADSPRPEVELNAYRSGVDIVLSDSVSPRELSVRLGAVLERLESVRVPPTGPACAIHGELSEFLILELIQWLNQSRKTGRLWLSKGYQRGAIDFEKGEIIHARLDVTGGEEAVYAMAAWKEGRFEFDISPRKATRNVRKPTVEILLECGRRLDEARIQPLGETVK